MGSSNKLNPICSGRIGQPPKLGANTANRHLPVGPLTTNEICVPINPSISPSIVFDRNKSAKSRINRSFSLFVLDSAPTQKGAARLSPLYRSIPPQNAWNCCYSGFPRRLVIHRISGSQDLLPIVSGNWNPSILRQVLFTSKGMGEIRKCLLMGQVDD